MNPMSRMSGDRHHPPKKKKAKEEPAAPAPQAPRRGLMRVVLTEDASNAYRELPGNVKESVDEIIRRLEGWPEVSGVRSLWGAGHGKYRMKTWDWRVEFIVDDKARQVTVLRIGHRSTFYDEYHR